MDAKSLVPNSITDRISAEESASEDVEERS